MKKILILVLLFNLKCADSERQNCREDLDSLEFQKIMALSLLSPNPRNVDQTTDESKNLAVFYFTYIQNKAQEKKQKCDNDLLLQIFSPEANDFN